MTIYKALFTRNVCVCIFVKCQEWVIWQQVMVLSFQELDQQRAKKNVNAVVMCEWTRNGNKIQQNIPRLQLEILVDPPSAVYVTPGHFTQFVLPVVFL